MNNVIDHPTKKQALPSNMVAFVQAYIQCILDHATEGGKMGGAEDEEYTLAQHGYREDDMEDAFQFQIADDCTSFLTKAYEFIDLAVNADEFNYDYRKAGQDFWLSRNRYGDAFWVRGIGVLGKRLTDLAEEFKHCTVYVNDAGKVCCS